MSASVVDTCIVKGILATIREEIHGKEMLVIALIV